MRSMMNGFMAVMLLFLSLLLSSVTSVSAKQSLDGLDYRVFPRRTSEEAAVLEWGHSAIISALDASVAQFGPQSSQAALMEVECRPVLASPLNGKLKDSDESPVQVLENADDIEGNMAVMTSTGGLTGLQMAKIAKKSGAAALLVVNVDENHPDDIYSLPREEGVDGYDEIDIPVVMISLNSANVLTTATVTPDMKPSNIVNHGMPGRVRLYAGDDRPFFEDVGDAEPTLYLIHNLLSEQECDALVESAENKVMPATENDPLQLLEDASKAHKVDRVLLWKGALKTRANKEVDERIEQVTGFPAEHYSDFVITKYEEGSFWAPHYDTHPTQAFMATVTIFLEDGNGPEVVYPSASGQPVKIVPRKGMAIVHHNYDDTEQATNLDVTTLHAFMPATGQAFVAQKHVFYSTVSPTRRIVLPMVSAPFGGKLPGFIVKAYNMLVAKFGFEQGSVYFDKLFMVVPVLILVSLAQWISNIVQEQWKSKESDKKKEQQPKKAKVTTSKRDKRKKA